MGEAERLWQPHAWCRWSMPLVRCEKQASDWCCVAQRRRECGYRHPLPTVGEVAMGGKGNRSGWVALLDRNWRARAYERRKTRPRIYPWPYPDNAGRVQQTEESRSRDSILRNTMKCRTACTPSRRVPSRGRILKRVERGDSQLRRTAPIIVFKSCSEGTVGRLDAETLGSSQHGDASWSVGSGKWDKCKPAFAIECLRYHGSDRWKTGLEAPLAKESW